MTFEPPPLPVEGPFVGPVIILVNEKRVKENIEWLRQTCSEIWNYLNEQPQAQPQPMSPQPTPPVPSPTPRPNRVNVDTGIAVAFVAEGSAVLPQLEAYVSGKQMVMARTAVTEFFKIMITIGGSNERARAASFMSRVQEVEDDPSERALNLKPTGGIGQNDIIIFGTGDRLGIKTMTTDGRAVRAAESQGVKFDADIYPAAPLTGK
jgi:hypothetical protein